MAEDIFINTDLPIDQCVVIGTNRPTRQAPLTAFVEGADQDVNLYLIKSDGSFDSRSGAAVSVDVAVARDGAEPQSGTFTISEGANQTAPIEYGSGAQAVEDALNALNDGAGPNGLVDVSKLANDLYSVVWRENGAQSALVGESVNLTPESSVAASVSVVGDATTREQQIISIDRQPSIFQGTWNVVTDGFNATLSADNSRVSQALKIEQEKHFYFEVKIGNDILCKVPCEVTATVSLGGATLPPDPTPSALNAFAADPTSNSFFDPDEWRSDLMLESSFVSLGLDSEVNGVGELGGVAVGAYSLVEASNGVALGADSLVQASNGIALGANSFASASSSVQIGSGTNSTASTIQFLGSGSITADQFGKLSDFGDKDTETTLTDDDAKIPTSGAVFDYAMPIGTVATVTATAALIDSMTTLVDDDSAGSSVSLFLPIPSIGLGVAGMVLKIKKIGNTDNVTIKGNAGATIDGAASVILENQYQSITIVSDGSNWHII